MSKFRVSGNKSSILVYPTVKPELSLDLVNNPEGIDPAYSFTRNSAGTYVDPNGIIRTAAVNQPRFDYDPVTGEYKGLLIEESRTNLLLRSGQIGTSPWGIRNNLGNSAIVVQNSMVAPDGNLAATKVTISRTGNDFSGIFQNISSISGTYTFSAWMRLDDGVSNKSIQIYAGDLIYNRITVNLTSAWQRKTVTFTVGSYTYVGIGNWYSALPANWIGSTPFYIWGAQLEQGSFPTSYIPTTSSTVTRQPDQLLINKPINLNGTFFIESSISTLKDQQTLFNANDGTNSFVLKNSNGNIAQNTTNYASNNYSSIDTNYTKRIISYQNSKNVFMSSSNIENSVEMKTPGNLSFTPDRISIGYDNLNSNRELNGYIKKFSYYPKALTDNECRALVNDKQPLNYVAPVAVGGDDVYQINVNGDTYIVHRFLDVGTSSLFLPIALEVEYLVVGGGGGGGGHVGSGNCAGGGGGAGGLVIGTDLLTSGTYFSIVGNGGSITSQAGNNGENSAFNGIIAYGGGGGAGGGGNNANGPGKNGASGGGGAGGVSGNNLPGTQIYAQGNNGGNGSLSGGGGAGGGGGGYSSIGLNASGYTRGLGGSGFVSTFSGFSAEYAKGGDGGNGLSNYSSTIANGSPNTGNGGFGNRSSSAGIGGSGIVIIRYKV